MKRKLTLMKSSSAKPAKPGGNGLMRFAEVFPDPKILTSLMSKLGWTHFLHLIRLDDRWNACHYSNEFKKKARK